MSKLTDLVSALSEIQNVREKEKLKEIEKEDFELSTLLIRAIKKTNREIKLGLDVSLFQDLVIVNFLILAAQKKHPVEEIERFVNELKREKSEQ